MLIDKAGIDFPRTYANLIADENTNTILNSMENKKKYV